jgi:hypothetical protein
MAMELVTAMELVVLAFHLAAVSHRQARASHHPAAWWAAALFHPAAWSA